MRFKKYLVWFLFFAEIVAFSLYLFKKDIDKYPQSIHSWAQYDRIALALNFMDNDFDFFHPRTYCLNTTGIYTSRIFLKEYTGITSVDFPVHDFNAAQLMNLFDTRKPIVFKLYILVLGLLSLVALALLTNKLRGGTSFLILVLPAFMLTIPVINFYLPGFLPSVPSMSFTLFAVYFLMRFATDVKRVYFLYLSNLFFLISVLPRTTHFIYLFAALLFLTWMIYAQKIKLSFKYFIPFLVSFSIITAYYIYNAELRSNYGTMFMFWLIPPEGFLDFLDNETKAFNNWGTHYFTLPHYIVLIASALLIVINRKKLSDQVKNILVFLLISFIGVSLFRILLNQQFILHDYYFIDTFYILAFLLLATALSLLKIEAKKGTIIFSSALMVFGISSLYLCNKKIKERNEYAYFDRNIEISFRSAGRLLRSLPENDSIVPAVMYKGSPNAALVHMKRQGFVFMGSDSSILDASFKYPFNTLIVPVDFYKEQLQKNDWYMQHFDSLRSNTYVKVFKRKI